VPEWQLSDGELTAALLHAHTVQSQGYGRMLTLIAEADGRGLATCKGYRDTAAFLAGALRLSASQYASGRSPASAPTTVAPAPQARPTSARRTPASPHPATPVRERGPDGSR
jgi:hypothetical protein